METTIAFTGCDLLAAARAQARPTARGHARSKPAGRRPGMATVDHPIPWQDKAVDHILKAPGFTNAERRAMLGETAAKLLGIKV
jgi:hypothetical protein